MTYVRISTVQADPSKVEEGIRFAHEQGLATLRQQPGFARMWLLADRSSGKMISVSQWENEAAAQAADGPLSQTRARGAHQIGAATPTSELFEMVIDESA
jgi:heme-degrading monooxygenase HmoA